MERGCRPFSNPNDLDHLASIDFAPMDYVTQPGVTGPTRYCVAEPTGVHSGRQANGRHWNPCCAAPSKTTGSSSRYWPTRRGPTREASRLTEALRRYDDSYHHELAWWTALPGNLKGYPKRAGVRVGGSGGGCESPVPH
ncbi:putative nAD(P)H nitroreductase acg [Mycobacterium kansasii]|uniref:Putative nAD(P)H nitroreductase acg n=1 Tax=Mycobacterium kansasii TaxID=1768 RepID=A0A1V3W8S3_MYCKA|nr:putative nAD(P)H nitroreductase acg [Mycobacterium kansasii]